VRDIPYTRGFGKIPRILYHQKKKYMSINVNMWSFKINNCSQLGQYVKT
jgi:hypothetical protein